MLYCSSSNSPDCVLVQKCHMSLFGHADRNLPLHQFPEQTGSLTTAHRGVTATPTGENVSNCAESETKGTKSTVYSLIAVIIQTLVQCLVVSELTVDNSRFYLVSVFISTRKLLVQMGLDILLLLPSWTTLQGDRAKQQ